MVLPLLFPSSVTGCETRYPEFVTVKKKAKLFIGSAVALTAILLLITAADVFPGCLSVGPLVKGDFSLLQYSTRIVHRSPPLQLLHCLISQLFHFSSQMLSTLFHWTASPIITG